MSTPMRVACCQGRPCVCQQCTAARPTLACAHMRHATSRMFTDRLSGAQSTLKDFQNTMKVARSKEASSLPKPSPAELAKLQAPGGPLEEAEAGRGDPLESAALLQVCCLHLNHRQWKQ